MIWYFTSGEGHRSKVFEKTDLEEYADLTERNNGRLEKTE